MDLSSPDPNLSGITLLQDQLELLVQNHYSLDRAQRERRDKAVHILNAEDTTSKPPSDQKRRRYVRVIRFLSATAASHSSGAAFLCLVAISISQLDEKRPKLSDSFAAWWEHVPVKNALEDLARRDLQHRLSDTGRALLSIAASSDQSKSSKRPSSAVASCSATQPTYKVRKPNEPVLGGEAVMARPEDRAAGGTSDVDAENETSDESSDDTEDEHFSEAEGVANHGRLNTSGDSEAAMPNSRLTGNVYMISSIDAIKAICGIDHPEIRLTIPVHKEDAAFITIHIPRATSRQLAEKNPQWM